MNTSRTTPQDHSRCQLCGESMPDGEEMFNYHGFSGPCPRPPMPKPKLHSVIEYFFREATNGEFWIDIHADRKPYTQLGPFDTAAERQRAHDDLMAAMRAGGAIDLPNEEQ